MRFTRRTGSTQRRYRAAGGGAIAAAFFSAVVLAQPTTTDIVYFDYRVVNSYPHDPNAYTQGLLVHDGDFFESTGIEGDSSVRRVDIETGDVKQHQALPDQFFGEGMTLVDDRLIMLTYRAGVAFVLSKDGFRRIDQFRYAGEGWGLAHDGARLIMSDGTDVIEFRDPETFHVVESVKVTYRGRPLNRLNELEFIEGRIYANVYTTDQIVRINPDTGAVDAVIDLTGLLPETERGAQQGKPPEVLNGVAHDAETGRLFVTGKYWPKVYEIELVARSQ
ncbi:MAG: glutaminyl-peptide cyclotransferase [Pseudomonadota bacterium]